MRFIKILTLFLILFIPSLAIAEEDEEFSVPYGGYLLELVAPTPNGAYIMPLAAFTDPYWGGYMCNIEKENMIRSVKPGKDYGIMVVCAKYRESEL